MSKSEQFQTPFPDLNKYLVDYIERTAKYWRLEKRNRENIELIISNKYNKTKENIQMAYEYIQQRIPSYIDIDKMPLLYSLSIVQHDNKYEIMNIFRIFSSEIHIFFSKDSYNYEIGRAWRQTFGMHNKINYFKKITDATKDIIWFMYYDCDESSMLCGIWCGQSYIDACQLIGYDIKNLNENNFPIISWSCCQCSSTLIYLEDINLRSFIEQGSIPSGFIRQSIAENIVELMDENSENLVDPFRILNLTIDKNLFDENLSENKLDQQLRISRENRLLAVYGENQLKLLSSSLKTYFNLIQKSINNDEVEIN